MDSLKSLCPLWAALARNQRYRHLVETEDFLTFQRRAEHEGITFLTTTLPSIGKALDNFHSTTLWSPPEHFVCEGDGIPKFLGKAIKAALNGDSLAVDCVRQLTFAFYKLEVQYAKATIGDFLDSFIAIDMDLPDATTLHSDFAVEIHVALMRRLITRVLCNTSPWDIRPCHGSGATACRTKNWDKWHKLRYYPQLDAVYPYADYFFYNYAHLADELQMIEEGAVCSPQARVVLVPKDSRGPRVISCEPAELLFIQQGLMRLLYQVLESNNLTAGRVNFSDQEVNRELARQGSISGEWATLDLSEASDRVSLDLIRAVFPLDWVTCLEASRSDHTELPDGRIVKLKKFAPMGSSCCFPVEALVFWASCVATLQRQNFKWEITNSIKSDAVNDRNINACFPFTGSRTGEKHDVYVYGDDIIIRPANAEKIMFDLESIGLKVNRPKSYVSGPFRESCGGDYHNGYDVTPVRFRKALNESGISIAACSDLCNEFIAKFGYNESAEVISVIEMLVGYTYPRTLLDIPMTIRATDTAVNTEFFKKRYNKRFQRVEYRVLKLITEVLTLREPAWSELLKKELTRERYSDVFAAERKYAPLWDREPLLPGQYAVPHSAVKKWGWVWLG